MEPLCLRVRQAAVVLGLSPAQTYAMTRSGELPSVRVGRAVLVPVAELRTWLSQRAAREPEANNR